MEGASTGALIIASDEDLELAVNRLKLNDPPIQTMWIRRTDNGDDSPRRLRTIVDHICPHLAHFHAIKFDTSKQYHGDIWIEISLEIAKMAEPLLNSSHQLKILSTKGCADAEILSRILRNPQCSLEELVTSSSFIGDAGCISIMEALHHNSSLKSLNLSENAIGLSGCQAIAAALQDDSCTLESVEFDDNDGDDGGVYIAHALENNTVLKKISLSFCCGSRHGQAFATLLQNDRNNLEDLTLSVNCDCEGDIITSFGNALRHNTTLRSFILIDSRTNIGNDGWDAMELALREKNYTLQEFIWRPDIPLSIAHHLALNRECPVESKATKMGIFPQKLLLKSLGANSSCTVEMIGKVTSYQNLSVLFSFVQECPSIFVD